MCCWWCVPVSLCLPGSKGCIEPEAERGSFFSLSSRTARSIAPPGKLKKKKNGWRERPSFTQAHQKNVSSPCYISANQLYIIHFCWISRWVEKKKTGRLLERMEQRRESGGRHVSVILLHLLAFITFFFFTLLPLLHSFSSRFFTTPQPTFN